MKSNALGVVSALLLSVGSKGWAGTTQDSKFHGDLISVQAAVGQALDSKNAPRKPSEGPRVGFIPESSVDLKNSEGWVWAKAEKGTVDGLPAKRVRFSSDGSVLVVRGNGKAGSWNQARAACRGLFPAGAWDLPLDEDFMALLWTEAVDIRIDLRENRLLDASDKAGLYPLWVRLKDESKNTKVFADTANLVSMRDGRGTDMEAVDVGPGTVANLRQGLADADRGLKEGRYRTDEEERSILKAVEDYNRRTGRNTSFNLDMPHPGVLPDFINGLLEKPAKSRLLMARDNASKLLAAFQDGYQVYCVAR